MLGIRHILVAVNKLDQVGFSQAAFETIVSAYRDDGRPPRAVRLHGDPGLGAARRQRGLGRASNTPWYRGPSLLEWLEQAPSALDDNQLRRAPLRFAVQLVLRGFDPLDGGGARGYGGRVEQRRHRPGQRVRVLPSGMDGEVHSVSTFDGPLAGSAAGPVDRGAAGPRARHLARRLAGGETIRWRSRSRRAQFSADLAWLDSAPLALQRKLWLRHGTRWVQARIRRIEAVLDLASVEWRTASEQATLGPNDIARVVVETQQPIALDPYDRIRASGGFVLADAATNHTVAAGMARSVTDGAGSA